MCLDHSSSTWALSEGPGLGQHRGANGVIPGLEAILLLTAAFLASTTPLAAAPVAASAPQPATTKPSGPFEELQVIDHWNLRYMDFEQFPLSDQVAQVKANLDAAAWLGFTSYLLFAKETFQHLVSWDGRSQPDSALQAAMRDILAHAKRRGIAVYFHSNEFMWPASVKVAYQDTPEAWAAYRGALTEFIKLFPDIAGFEVTGDETEGMQRGKATLIKFHRVTAEAVASDGKPRLALMRTWQRCSGMGKPVDLGRDDPVNVLFSIKQTKGDFHMLNPYDAAFINAAGDPSRLIVEFDAWREYETHNVFPLYLGDNWAPVFRAAAQRGIQRVAIRVNWNSGRFPALLSRPWANYVNVAIFLGFARNPDANPDDLLREYVASQYPEAARDAAFAVYKASFDYVKSMYYVRGKYCADHGRVPKAGKRSKPTDERFREIDSAESRMLAMIDVLPAGTPQQSELARGARSLANFARACAVNGGLSGPTDFLQRWLSDDPDAYAEMRGELTRQ
jgi:hypothetical protein